MKKRNEKGFTLVELVIVIAVIAILSAVLIPTFSNVIENAKESAALQEASSLRTQILVETKDGFDAYCVAHESDTELVSNSKLTIEGYTIELSGAGDFKIGKNEKGEWTIAYITESGYVVSITDSDISATKGSSLPTLTNSENNEQA